ncbi:hypothetical protein A1O1_00001 [Capronia coronata CBS 617.96]|uniref:Copper acquisition factor BIM1-like domain-containing protein n=1 Tax=Capronia coronata CBS 617.96 TaxID=1182541 RepID=W9YQT6_9EURO|nr:uncharacterized protein A1O1_00001 [Capronia coronata CBS 617.96]EXJ94883.1 hypothetical protein A1O1_00001 [Capronia coronata CBS 617.96]
MLSVPNVLLLLLAYTAGRARAQEEHGEEASKEMGPVAFMWPPDRLWGADVDNRAPCGSASAPGNRTIFPLLNGVVSLVAQDESWEMTVSISYNSNPTSNDDFEEIIAATHIPEVDEGHTCYPVPNPPTDVEAGANATLQLKYTSDFDTDKNETFYACADISFVSTSQFDVSVPCFNATTEDFTISDNDSSDDDSSDGTSTSSSASSSTTSSSSSSSGLSGGAIAGIVVGVVAGVIIIAGLVFYGWRRDKQLKRLRRAENNLRNIKWDEQNRASESSQPDIPLGNMAK